MTEPRHESDESTDNDGQLGASRLFEEVTLPGAPPPPALTEAGKAALPHVMLVEGECKPYRSGSDETDAPGRTRAHSDRAGAKISPPEEASAALVEQLGSRSFKEREQAMQSLMQRGVAAFDALADGLGTRMRRQEAGADA